MYSPSFLSQKIVLVTGASSGIGEITARFLAHKGLKTILIARREEKLAAIVKGINSAGGKADYIVKDLTIEQERDSLFSELKYEGKIPDILINNAGIGWYGYYYEMPWTAAKELLSINVEAVAHLTSLFLPEMLAKNYGHIVNIGSVAGKLPEQGIAIYASSKAFLDSFTTIIHRELIGSNVHISVLRAGPIKTEFFDAARKMKNGGNIPAENLATSGTEVAKRIWVLLQFPRKVAYIPCWMVLSPLLETFFEGFIDLAGPLLLKKQLKSKNRN